MKHSLLPLLLSLSLVVATGCGCYKHFPPQQQEVRDSVAVHIVDSIAIKYVTVEVEIPHETSSAIVASSDSSHLETSLAVSDSYIDSLGHLHHTLKNKDLKLEKEIPVEEHYHSLVATDHFQETRTVTIEVERKLTPMQLFWQSSGKFAWCVLLIGLLAVAIRIAVKFWLKV